MATVVTLGLVVQEVQVEVLENMGWIYSIIKQVPFILTVLQQLVVQARLSLTRSGRYTFWRCSVSRCFSLCYGADGAALEGGGATGDASSCNFNGPYLWETFSSGGANGHPGQGGAGYYGGGGGGSVYTYCGAGGGGGSSWADSSVTTVTYLDGAGQIQGNEAMSAGAGRGGERDYGGAQDNGADGRILLTW